MCKNSKEFVSQAKGETYLWKRASELNQINSLKIITEIRKEAMMEGKGNIQKGKLGFATH